MRSQAVELQKNTSTPWQLDMFQRSLKKQQKLQQLLRILGPLQDQKCLLITAGDNSGALNWHFRAAGGAWTWADADPESVLQIAELTGEPVLTLNRDRPSLPLSRDSFDIVLTIDVHEHLQHPYSVNRELFRLVRPGGRVVVTTPSGDQGLLVNRLKALLRMHPEDYGHLVHGFTGAELEEQLSAAGLSPYERSGYAGHFTELIELAINFAYVKLLGKKQDRRAAGQIAPQTQAQLKSVGAPYRLYSAIFPVLKTVAGLDRLLPHRVAYAVIVAARKP